ncbi:hypothetical protein B5F77_00950 [Parabacteroides sp. An277]|uniref:DUF6383 domain-containing protein n=1 Tax=Parabacteroides sp. An277 TaxID=1965619 RepID=UPI000B585EE9|nr:DUF6383 domain-containing protein [Parabacteroides sp. An277]OUO55456.1 hypothetical protein B5F77_00950 [Parabacteroides sp. An277]
MNKKFSTLVAAMLVSSSFAFAETVSQTPAQLAEQGIEVSSNRIIFTENVDLGDNYLLISDSHMQVIGNGYTLKGRIVVTGEDVTINNLNIVLENKAGNATYQKTAIVVYASSATITNNKIECIAVDGNLANGISIFPKTEDAAFTVSGNTIENANAAVDTWLSTGIMVCEGLSLNGRVPGVTEGNSAKLSDPEKTSISNNTYEDCACDYLLVEYSSNDADSDYKLVQVTPLKNEDGTYANQTYINSLVNNTAEGAEVIFNGTSETLLDALSNKEEGFEGESAAVQCSDKNLLFGTATDPDNGKASNVVMLGEGGKVTANTQSSAPETIQGYELQAKNSDNYFLLGFKNATSGKFYVATADENGTGKVIEITSTNAASLAANPAYLWKMSENKVGDTYQYTFTNKLGVELHTSAASSGSANPTGMDKIFTTEGNAAYANGFVLSLDANGTADSNGFWTLNLGNNQYWGLYESGEKAFTAGYLNDLEGASFALTIKDNTGKKDALEGEDMFGSSIVAEASYDGATSYKFKVGEKYIVLDTEDSWSDNGIEPDGLGYKFKTISKETLDKDTKGRYKSDFTIYYRAGEETTVDANGNIIPTAKTAIERIVVGGYTLSTFNTEEKDYLTVSTNEKLFAVISFGGGNRADITKLLTGKFVNIEFVNKEYKTYSDGKTIDKDQQYKMGKMLAMQATKEGYNLEAEYIGTTKGEYPEAQWAVEYNQDNNTATFINRENPDVKVENVVLYNTDEANVYAITSVNGNGYANAMDWGYGNVMPQDTVKLTFVTTGMFDGFKHDITNLQDTIYNIAAFKAVNNVNDAYWVEKNHSTTHQIGLDGDIENAGEWNLHVAMKPQRDADGEIVKNEKDEPVMVPDTVFVKSTLYTWDATKGAVPSESVLAIFPYAIQNNDNNEFVKYDGTHGVEYYVADKDNKTSAETADNFALKIQPDGYHIVTLNTRDYDDAINSEDEDLKAYAESQIKLYGNYDNELEVNYNVTTMGDKVFAGNAATRGTLDRVANYSSVYNDVMTITPVGMPEYRPVVKANEAAFDTVRIYRDENHSQLLYEKKDNRAVVANDTLSFLNIDNENQFKLADAIFVDTAYVNRGNNTCWQYLLVVDPNNVSEWYCPVNEEHNTEAWREANGVEHCHDAIRKNYVEGRFLVNLMDTANVYETVTQHNNPYVNEVEAGVFQAKLAFVPGKHFGDTLVLYKDEAMTQVKDSLFLGDKDFNIAKFAFRYHDNAAGSFKIQTLWKEFNEDGALRFDAATHNNGYLRWENGTVVVADSYDKGDVFNMTENYIEGNPTANESITAEGAVSVVATDGAVVIKGAEGKNVVIATILGKVVANETINSDNETIAVPAGIAVVSVDGESFKVVVK